MSIASFARWRGPVPNMTPGGMANPSLGLVLHVMESTLAAADGWFHNPAARASAHFGVDFDGTIVQWVEWESKAWAEVAGNPNYHSVETAGDNNTPLTDAQVRGVATIYNAGHQMFGWPLALADAPGQRGLGTHAMGGSAWGGHTACPGPQRTAQRTAILELVGGGAGPIPTPGGDMVCIFQHGNGLYVGVLGAWRKHIPTPGVFNMLVRHGTPINNTDGTAIVQDDVFNATPPLGTVNVD